MVASLNMATAGSGIKYRSQDPSAISSRSYPNCSTCFVVELEALYHVGFDMILWGCRLGEFVFDVELL